MLRLTFRYIFCYMLCYTPLVLLNNINGITTPHLNSVSYSLTISGYPSFLSRILYSEYCIEVDKKHTSNVQDTVDFTPQSFPFSFPQDMQMKKCTSSHIQVSNMGAEEQGQSRYQVRRIVVIDIMIPSLIILVPLVNHIPPPGLPIVYS